MPQRAQLVWSSGGSVQEAGHRLMPAGQSGRKNTFETRHLTYTMCCPWLASSCVTLVPSAAEPMPEQSGHAHYHALANYWELLAWCDSIAIAPFSTLPQLNTIAARAWQL